jgi:hypothetical protein
MSRIPLSAFRPSTSLRVFDIPHSAFHFCLAAVLLLAVSCARDDAKAPPPVGRLQVTSDPAKATVLIDRKVRGETPLTIPDLPVGQHLVTVRKQGCLDAWQTVELLGQDARSLDFKLETVTGLLLLQSSPSNAEVSVNGVALGHTPLLISTLPPGTHRFKIATPGYQPKEVEVQLDDRTPVRKRIDLVSNSATLTVETDAEGANIRINGLDRGGSPCTVDRIPEGDVVVELRADGYAPLTQKIKLEAGETQKIKLPMTPIPASLKIVSIPEKARVYINNEPRGLTPLELPDLAPGKYRVRVELEGFEPNARDVEMGRGARKSEEFRLTSNTGKLELITEPDRVTVFLDGKKVGETKAKADATTNVSDPLSLETIMAGEHELRLVRKGHAESKQKILIEQGKTLPLHVKLTRRFIPDCLVVTIRGVEYRGVLDAATEDTVRLETAPGVITTFPLKDVKYQRTIREDGTLD